MPDQHPVQRSFEHCYSPSLDNYPLKKGEVPEDRGFFLVCVEFLTGAAFNQRAVCAMTSHFPWVSELSKLFPRVTFVCFDSRENDAYDPENPQANVRHVRSKIDRDSLSHLNEKLPTTPLLLISLADDPQTQENVYEWLDPNRALLAVSEMPQEFLSGTMYYPVYSPLSSPVSFLSVPHRAVRRIYDPKVLQDEIAFFHLLVRCAGLYDGQAETWILTDHAVKVMGYQRDNCWNAVNYARGLVPR